METDYTFGSFEILFERQPPRWAATSVCPRCGHGFTMYDQNIGRLLYAVLNSFSHCYRFTLKESP